MHRRALFFSGNLLKYLSFYLKFNGNYIDLSNNPLTTNGNASGVFVASSLNQAFQLTTTSDRINVPFGQSNISKLQLCTDTADVPFSISARVKLNSSSVDHNLIIGRYLIGDSDYEYFFTVLPNRKIIMRKWSQGNGNIYTQCTCDTALNFGEYYNIVYTDDAAGNRKFYLNGVLQTSTNTNVGTYVRMSPRSGVSSVIGAAPSSPENNLFKGELDDLFVLKNKVLSQAEITWLNNGGNGREIR